MLCSNNTNLIEKNVEFSTVSKAMNKELQPTETFNVNNKWEVNKGVKLDVPNFYGDHNIDVFLD